MIHNDPSLTMAALCAVPFVLHAVASVRVALRGVRP